MRKREMYVLLVEDDPRVARVVERALAEADHRVDVAHDGEEGLARAESGAYDLIVLDVMLPEIDGIEVARGGRGGRARTPILMLAAAETGATPGRRRDAGPAAY